MQERGDINCSLQRLLGSAQRLLLEEKLSPQVTDEVSLRSSVFLNNGCYASYTSSVSPLGCHLIDYGMIAPGNHLDFRSATRSTTLKGKALLR